MSTHERNSIIALVGALDVLVQMEIIPGNVAAATVIQYAKRKLIDLDALKALAHEQHTLTTPTAH